MHLLAHSATAIPFAATGHWWAALGAVLPDITWAYNEYRYRKAGGRFWHLWAERALTPLMVMPYRIAHSFLLIVPLCAWMGWWEFLIGWMIHVLMDLPTHSGVMTQQPLYPFTWRWKWILRSYF